MDNWLIYLGLALALLLVAALALNAYRFQREARRRREDVRWLVEQVNRALEDIHANDDEDRILSGLQILTYVKDSDARLKALPRLAELAQSPNPLIARQAKVTMEKLSNFAGR